MGVEIVREAAEPASAGRGLCGTVQASPGFKRVVQARWGGGSYVATGYRSDGKPTRDYFELPGSSKPLVVEEDDDEDHAYAQYAPPWANPPWAQPGGGNPAWWMAQMGPYGQRPAHAQAFSQRDNREIDRLTREVDRLQLELVRVQDQARRDAEAARDKFETAQRDLAMHQQAAMIAKIQADHQKQLSDLQINLGGNKGEPQGDNRVMFEALRANSEILTSVIAGSMKGNLSTADLIQIMERKGSGIQDALKLHQAIQSAANPDAGADESWQSVAKSAVKNVAPVLQDFVRAQVSQPDQPQSAQPAQQQAPKQIPQQEQTPVGAPWSKIVHEVTTYYENKNKPNVAASHFRAFYRALDEWDGAPGKTALLQGLGMAKSSDLVSEIDKLVAFYEGAEKDRVQAFANVLRSEEGAKWIDEFLANLTPKASA